MKHPKFIVAFRDSFADPIAWEVNQANEKAEIDAKIGRELLEEVLASRERSLPSYFVVYFFVLFLTVVVVGLVALIAWLTT